jgi:hypothetical protein
MRAGSRPATDRQVRETLLLPMMTNATLTELRSMPKIAREELSGHSSSSDDRDCAAARPGAFSGLELQQPRTQ